jgi:hypothetical protein
MLNRGVVLRQVLKCDSDANLEFRWKISVDIINLILKASAQHLISFILHDGRN